MTSKAIRNLRRGAGGLVSFPLGSIPPIQLLADKKSFGYGTQVLFASNGKSFFDFPGNLPPLEQVEVDHLHIRAIQIWACAIGKQTNYYITIGEQIDLLTLTPPLNFGFTNQPGAVIQATYIVNNSSGSTKTLGVDPFDDNLRLQPFPYVGDSGSVITMPAYIYDVNNDTFTNKVTYFRNGEGHNPGESLNEGMLAGYTLPDGAGTFFLIGNFDEDNRIMDEAFAPQGFVPTAGVSAYNVSGADWHRDTDPWSNLTLDVINFWPGGWIGVRGGEPEIVASRIAVQEGYYAIIDSKFAVYDGSAWVYSSGGSTGSDNNTYVYKTATPAGNLYDDWNNAYDAADTTYGVKNLWVGNDGSTLGIGFDGAIYEMANYYVREYMVGQNEQRAVLSLLNSSGQKTQMSLPRLLDNIYIDIQNSHATPDFTWVYTGANNPYPVLDMKGISQINFSGTMINYIVGGMGSPARMTINMYDDSVLSGGGAYGISVYDNDSSVNIHLYDRARLESGVISPTTYQSLGAGSARKQVYIHIHSPYVKVDPSYLNSENYTIVWHGYYKMVDQPVYSLENVSDAITGIIRDDTNKWGTVTGAVSGISAGDWIEISGIDPVGYNLLVEVIYAVTPGVIIVRYPDGYSDPGSFVSDGIWTKKKVIRFGYTSNGTATKCDPTYIQDGGGFNIKLRAQIAANTNVKKLWIMAYDHYNGNNATIYQNNDIDSSVGDAIDLWVDALVQQPSQASLVSDVRCTQIASTPSTKIEGQYYTSGFALQNTDLLVVMDTEADDDIQIVALSTTPA